ncbi:hypothetical protein J4E83_000799 [Alternaria metachromatica]|uniref:uncharacterized protein n=1 Tax=Alternaria metachromatica TaxID=283354 RepID=UPI0020C5212D|nr:uncharacterized protein J4E83_000799 [Alternaria metachromatica]KAI4637978.1 hypothetical protein J4E83_000799 [Alternaria metachromatica]
MTKKSATRQIWGYTNEFHMFDTFGKILTSSPYYFVAHGYIIARNEKDIKEAKEKNGGAVPIDEDLAHRNTGDNGWITKGSSIMSPLSTKIKSHVYSITYPKTSSKESSIPNENIGVGITNHIPFITLLEQLVNCPDFRAWKVAHVGFLTRGKAEKRNKRKEKDGDIVDIVRGEWKSDGYGRWATAGCM